MTHPSSRVRGGVMGAVEDGPISELDAIRVAVTQLRARRVVEERVGSEEVGRHVEEGPIGPRNAGSMSRSVYAAPFIRSVIQTLLMCEHHWQLDEFAISLRWPTGGQLGADHHQQSEHVTHQEKDWIAMKEVREQRCLTPPTPRHYHAPSYPSSIRTGSKEFLRRAPALPSPFRVRYGGSKRVRSVGRKEDDDVEENGDDSEEWGFGHVLRRLREWLVASDCFSVGVVVVVGDGNWDHVGKEIPKVRLGLPVRHCVATRHPARLEAKKVKVSIWHSVRAVVKDSAMTKRRGISKWLVGGVAIDTHTDEATIATSDSIEPEAEEGAYCSFFVTVITNIVEPASLSQWQVFFILAYEIKCIRVCDIDERQQYQEGQEAFFYACAFHSTACSTTGALSVPCDSAAAE
ncbi:hypothetical protein CPC08DRAFT_821428 [Agrocybe pediades]|nr:hypothetical protein CPC08DRAFT_821428 [Agrocybe pediades]